jgi:serine/threonine-protein kinase
MADALEQPTAQIGGVLAGRFRVERRLGGGGMGSVFEAVEIETGRPVAMKLLHRKLRDNPEAVERFRREGEVLAAIGHPALVNVEHIGTLGDGTLYICMERLLGETLEAHLGRVRSLDPPSLIPLVRTLCDALAAVHARGVLHRDIKPANIFLCGEADGPIDLGASRVKLVDFGVAMLEWKERLTAEGRVLGTVKWMAPEQLEGERDLDERVDIYSIGVVLYEALAGKHPFGGPARMLLERILLGKAEPLRCGYPAVDDVVERAMARDRQRRHGSALELCDAYERAVFQVERRTSHSTGLAVDRALGEALSPAASMRPHTRPATRLPVERTVPGARPEETDAGFTVPATPRASRPSEERVAGAPAEQAGPVPTTRPPPALAPVPAERPLNARTAPDGMRAMSIRDVARPLAPAGPPAVGPSAAPVAAIAAPVAAPVPAPRGPAPAAPAAGAPAAMAAPAGTAQRPAPVSPLGALPPAEGVAPTGSFDATGPVIDADDEELPPDRSGRRMLIAALAFLVLAGLAGLGTVAITDWLAAEETPAPPRDVRPPREAPEERPPPAPVEPAPEPVDPAPALAPPPTEEEPPAPAPAPEVSPPPSEVERRADAPVAERAASPCAAIQPCCRAIAQSAGRRAAALRCDDPPLTAQGCRLQARVLRRLAARLPAPEPACRDAFRAR